MRDQPAVTSKFGCHCWRAQRQIVYIWWLFIWRHSQTYDQYIHVDRWFIKNKIINKIILEIDLRTGLLISKSYPPNGRIPTPRDKTTSWIADEK